MKWIGYAYPSRETGSFPKFLVTVQDLWPAHRVDEVWRLLEDCYRGRKTVIAKMLWVLAPEGRLVSARYYIWHAWVNAEGRSGVGAVETDSVSLEGTMTEGGMELLDEPSVPGVIDRLRRAGIGVHWDRIWDERIDLAVFFDGYPGQAMATDWRNNYVTRALAAVLARYPGEAPPQLREVTVVLGLMR